MSPRATRPRSSDDLSPSERSFVTLLRQLGFGRLESVTIRHGAVALDPRPTVVRVVKLGAAESQPPIRSADFELKKSMADLLEYIRSVDDGEIRRLEVRHGMPILMEVKHCISRGMPDVKEEHVEAV